MVPLNLSETIGPAVSCEGSLWSLLQHTAAEHPNNIALRCLKQPGVHLAGLLPPNLCNASEQQHFVWTYAQLCAVARLLAARLQKLGLTKGSVLVAFCSSSAEFAVLFWSCAAAGVILAPLNPRLLDRAGELRHAFDVLQPSAIATLDPESIAALSKSCSHIILSNQVKLKLVQSSESKPPPAGWQTLQTLFEDKDDSFGEKGAPCIQDSGDAVALILMTSGTTSLPKACPHTGRNLRAQTNTYHSARRLCSDSTTLAIGPVFHVQAIWFMLMAWRAGATLIFPSPHFDAVSIVDALNGFDCNYMTGSPSIMFALMSQPHFSQSGYPSLGLLGLGADRVDQSLVHRCQIAFKMQNVVNGWGMTESIGAIATPYGNPAVWQDDALTVGYVAAGSAVRICAPNSNDMTPVPRGQMGELQVSGTTIISEYYEKGEIIRTDAFCQSLDRTWFKTGDAAFMDSNGYVFLSGRYKDLIIRGGENVHPGLVESCLNSIPGIQSQVIGVDDEYLGQTIGAVLLAKTDEYDIPSLKEYAQERVREELGSAFVPTTICMLQEIDLISFPVTATGKVQKNKLREEVTRFTTAQQTPPQDQSRTTDLLIEIWRRLLGSGSTRIDGETSMTALVDSLIVLRFCFHVERQLKKRITPADVMNNETPDGQAQLLDAQIGAPLSSNTLEQAAADHATQKSNLTEDAQRRISSNLAQLGFTNSDVESAYLPHDNVTTFLTWTARPASDNFRWVHRVKHETSNARLREAIAQTLADHATLRTVVVPLEDNTTSPKTAHVVLKPSQKLSDTMVEESRVEEDAASLHRLAGDPDFGYAIAGRPALHATVVPVRGSSRPAMVLSVYHSVFDAISIGFFFDDLDGRLSGTTSGKVDWIPYKLYADMFRLHRGGEMGQENMKYQMEKLKDIDGLSKCLWPRLRGPGLMAGNDDGWRYANGQPGKPEERVSLNRLAGKERNNFIRDKIELPSLSAMKGSHGIEAFLLTKAALAIFNVEETGKEYAVYVSTEAGRSWPFMEPWVQQHLPNIMNVAGTTRLVSINVTPIDTSQTAGELLSHLAEAQRQDSLHSQAPWEAIMEVLGDRGPVLQDIAARQFINWDSSTQARARKDSKALERISRAATLDRGIMWNFGMANPTEMVAFVAYDDVHLAPHEVERGLKRILEAVKWFAEPANWNEPIGKVLQLRPSVQDS